jgi:hypothetical protein
VKGLGTKWIREEAKKTPLAKASAFESDERERKRKGKALAQRLASSTDDQ